MSTSSGQGGAPRREQLIESHLPLVRAIARRHAGRGETVEDLIQVGSIALIRACDRFDPERGVSFAAFATPAVEGEIRRHLGERTGSMRIPRDLQRMTGELERLRSKLAASLGRSPTPEELAVALGVEREDLERAVEAGRAREPSPAVSEDIVEATGELGSLQSTDDRLLLAVGTRVLDDRERRIVFLRFHADMTEREIAREVGISQAQVSRLLARALDKLRDELDDENFLAGAGGITKSGVIPATEGRAEPELRAQTRLQSPASGVGEIRIAGVGTPEEQARPGRPAEVPPKDDLALPYHVTVKREGDDQRLGWTATLDELPGCEARGSTPDQAVENLRSAMETWLSAAVDDPRVISPPRAQASKRKKASSPSGRFLVRMPSDLHEALSRAAEREQVSLNRFVTERLAASVAAAGAQLGPARTSAEASAPAARPARKPGFQMLLATNLLVMVLAAAAAVALLVLALERGI